MTLEQLKTLVAVAETGSFQAASVALHKSRPALSIAIKNLEEELGFEIFSRDQYRPVLTSKGTAFYEKAKNVLRLSENLTFFGEHLALGYEAQITISVNAVCPLISIMTLIHLMQNTHPHTKLNLKVGYGPKALEQLYSGEADLAVTDLPHPDPSLECIEWNTIKFLPVASPSFSLIEQQVGLSYEKLTDAIQIIVEEERQSPIDLLGDKKFNGEYWTVSDYYVKKQMLLSALGWGMMPEHMIQKELHTGNLVLLNIETIQEIKMETFLLRKFDFNLGPVAQEIWKSLQ